MTVNLFRILIRRGAYLFYYSRNFVVRHVVRQRKLRAQGIVYVRFYSAVHWHGHTADSARAKRISDSRVVHTFVGYFILARVIIEIRAVRYAFCQVRRLARVVSLQSPALRSQTLFNHIRVVGKQSAVRSKLARARQPYFVERNFTAENVHVVPPPVEFDFIPKPPSAVRRCRRLDNAVYPLDTRHKRKRLCRALARNCGAPQSDGRHVKLRASEHALQKTPATCRARRFGSHNHPLQPIVNGMHLLFRRIVRADYGNKPVARRIVDNLGGTLFNGRGTYSVCGRKQ